MNKEALFIYEEDGFCELRYTYGDLTKFERKAKGYDKLQSNWNSLREFFENGLQSSKTFKESDAIYEDSLMINKVLEVALDKMNELEGKDKDGKTNNRKYFNIITNWM